MSYITGRYNPSGTVIVQGLEMFLDAANPMNVNWTHGILRSNQTFAPYIDGGVDALTVASPGTQKISIVEVKTDGTDIKILDGSEVGTQLWEHIYNFGSNAPAGVNQWFSYRIVNTSGSAAVIAKLQMGLISGSATGGVYIYGDSAGKPDLANELASYGSVTMSVALADDTFDGGNKYLRTMFDGGTISVANGATIHIVWKVTSMGATLYFPRGTIPGTPAGFTFLYRFSTNYGSTWSVYGGDTNATNAVITLQTGGALAAPAADSGYVSIATIGDVSTPITETTDEITEGEPTGTQVQIVYNDGGYRP